MNDFLLSQMKCTVYFPLHHYQEELALSRAFIPSCKSPIMAFRSETEIDRGNMIRILRRYNNVNRKSTMLRNVKKHLMKFA